MIVITTINSSNVHNDSHNNNTCHNDVIITINSSYVHNDSHNNNK